MVRLIALIMMLFVWYGARASVKDRMLDVLSDYTAYPVRIVDVKSTARGFRQDLDYEILSYRVRTSSGRAWFLLKSGDRVFWTQVRFLVKVPVAVAVRSIERGERIAPSDVEPRFVWMDPMKTRGVVGYSEVVGKMATRRIDSGTILKSSMVRRPVLVKRGELVQFLLKDGGVRITGVAKAMRSGCKGDIVELRNLSSGKVFTGEVIGDGRVIVR